MRKTYLLLLGISTAISLLPFSASSADFSVPDNSDMFGLSLQQLSDLEVTSVSKKAEKESQAAAAIYVITQEDIRRSGMQNIPDLLRMVPGLDVAQSGSQNWAVSSRGFNSQFANKLLVLVDGRTVYNPVFSGVYWDVQNIMLENVDRIEVIRGPGATLWGANAVNGVINIITKSAKDTQGTLISAATGTLDKLITNGRYGGTEGNLSYRTYAQYEDLDEFKNIANPAHGITEGSKADDAWENGTGGFRLDWAGPGNDQETLQGDAYKGLENSQRFLPVTSAVSNTLYKPVVDTDTVEGMNVLGRWKHEFAEGNDATLQAYVDSEILQGEYLNSSTNTQTIDLDFQHNWSFNDRNDITWGAGYRATHIDFGNSFYISSSGNNEDNDIYNFFLQDKFAVLPDKVFLTLGSKFEHNNYDYVGLEYEPSARLSYVPTDTQTFWGAVSRAVHSPAFSVENLSTLLAPIPGVPTRFAFEQGVPEDQAETVITYELGYRVQPRENLSFDLTGFFNDYNSLASLSQGTGTLQFNAQQGYYVFIPENFGNANSGSTHGLEFASTWEVTKFWKLSGGYSLYYSELHIEGPSLVTQQGDTPKQQFNLRSYLDLPYNVQFDTMLYTVDALPELGVPGYARLDTRLGWSPMPGVDLSLIGQNLLQGEHQEYAAFIYQTPEEIGRSVIAKATIKF